MRHMIDSKNRPTNEDFCIEEDEFIPLDFMKLIENEDPDKEGAKVVLYCFLYV